MSLAVWRLSYMLVEEDGPYDWFETWRTKLGTNSEARHPNPHIDNIRGIFECVYCMSVWISFFFAALHNFNNSFAFYLALPFALSALAILLDKLHG